MSKTTTKELFHRIERLTEESIAWTDAHIEKRASIIMVGEELVDGKGMIRQCIFGGSPKILGHLLFEATLRNPQQMIPLLRMVADAAETHIKENS